MAAASIWTELEALGAGLAAQYLAGHKVEILGWVDIENDVLVDHIVAALEKTEPSGLQMALVKTTLNKWFDGLSAEEKAALPTTSSELFDHIVSYLITLASAK